MATVVIQVVVESRKATCLGPPSGSQVQASVAQAAIISSVMMPAPATARRCSRRASFHTSLVSVYATGHITRKARPMVGTRQP
ncbi:hypothetical protein JAB5_45110 [Janthinobacterium sp. HH103]|nr:hypothetical protein JAB5_45110 [Janthinobacterium sp. HH103]